MLFPCIFNNNLKNNFLIFLLIFGTTAEIIEGMTIPRIHKNNPKVA